MTLKLSDESIQEQLEALGEWQLAAAKLHREYVFKDFVAAWGFMSACALIAESSAHHPEWFNVYNKVIVDLTTHDCGGISHKDFELATKMEDLFARHSA